MINTGIFNFFLFENWDSGTSVLDPSIVHYAPSFDFIIHGSHPGTLAIFEYGNDTNAGATVTPLSWEINGVEFTAHRIVFAPTPGKLYYLKVGYMYSINLIGYKACDVLQITATNNCDNSHAPWLSSGITLSLNINDVIEGPIDIEDEQRQVVRSSGIEKKTINQILKRSVQFVGVPGLKAMLNALKTCSSVNIASFNGDIRIKNISVEAEPVENGKYYIYSLIFEYFESETGLSSCCDLLNLDDLLSPEVNNNPSTCADFEASISNSSGVLSVTLTNAPSGIPAYKWYRNGAYLTSSASITVSAPGDYRVEVKIGVQCKAQASYYIDDKCRIFQIQTSVLNGIISAVASNVPSGETVSYIVKKGGTQVATSLPYTATEEGAYFIEATAGACKTIKAEFVALAAACSYTIEINDLGAQLEAITNALSPIYRWELESATGRVEIANTAVVQKTGKGIYWLTIESGGCSKEVYEYVAPIANSICSVIARATGTEFTIFEIDLLSIENPGTDLLVIANNLVQIYTSSTPSLQNNYSINSAGKMIFANSYPLTNAILKVIRI
jgi:hypothetical protein